LISNYSVCDSITPTSLTACRFQLEKEEIFEKHLSNRCYIIDKLAKYTIIIRRQCEEKHYCVVCCA